MSNCKILLIDPPKTEMVYLKTKVRVGTPTYPSLSLALIAGSLINDYKLKY